MSTPDPDDALDPAAKAAHDQAEAARADHMRDEQKHHAYWRTNLTVVGILLVIWALVSYGAGIVFAPFLDQMNLPGTHFPLGFWFAQQGAIYTFVVLIFAYVIIMNRIEKSSGLSD